VAHPAGLSRGWHISSGGSAAAHEDSVGRVGPRGQRPFSAKIAPVRLSSGDLRTSIKVDFYELLRKSTLSREQVAGELGISVGELRRKLALDDVHCLAADQVPALCSYTGDYRVLHRIAEASGHAAVPLPEAVADGNHLLLALATTYAAVGRCSEMLAQALDDHGEAGSAISASELADLKQQGMEAVRRLLGFLLLAETREGQP
jgi:hypothetical protein